MGQSLKLAILGAGTIGTAVAIALSKGGFKVIATRRNLEKKTELQELGIELISDNEQAVRGADVVIISLKPFDLIKELERLKDHLHGKIIISLAAAVPLEIISAISKSSNVVRAMTNIAAKVKGGFTVYCLADNFPKENIEIVQQILSQFGDIRLVEEKYMDALTALSGSGPAYVLTIIESMMYAGLKVGLPRELALEASYQTIMGTAKLVSESGVHPSILKDLVVTPAGVTIDAIYELEDSGIRTAFMRAIESATKKSKVVSNSIREMI